MSRTFTFAIDAAGPNSDGSYDVVAPSQCKRVEVREDCDSNTTPTVDLVQNMPKGGLTPIKIAKGTSAIYAREAPWGTGDVVGTIKTRTGSATVARIVGDMV